MVIVATIAILTAAGCGPEKTPPPEVDGLPVVVAAGDIADCATEGDEATARLVEGIDGTVLTLGDNAYPDGSAENFAECYDPSWGQFKSAPSPALATTSTRRLAPQATSTTSVMPPETPMRATTPTTLDPGTLSPSTATVERHRSAVVPAPPRGSGSRRTSLPTRRRPCTLPLPSPAFHLWGVPSRRGTDGASLGDPLRRWRGCGAQRTRPQLPAFCPPGCRGRRIPRMASGSSW